MIFCVIFLLSVCFLFFVNRNWNSSTHYLTNKWDQEILWRLQSPQSPQNQLLYNCLPGCVVSISLIKYIVLYLIKVFFYSHFSFFMVKKTQKQLNLFFNIKHKNNNCVRDNDKILVFLYFCFVLYFLHFLPWWF